MQRKKTLSCLSSDWLAASSSSLGDGQLAFGRQAQACAARRLQPAGCESVLSRELCSHDWCEAELSPAESLRGSRAAWSEGWHLPAQNCRYSWNQKTTLCFKAETATSTQSQDLDAGVFCFPQEVFTTTSGLLYYFEEQGSCFGGGRMRANYSQIWDVGLTSPIIPVITLSPPGKFSA